LGDALVQGGVTPQRWINKWSNWLIKPATEFVPLAVVEQLVTRIRQIARRFRAHVDIEWAYDGRDLYFLQLREITTLNRHNIYSNHISKEMLPGIIKPLISSINLPLAGAVWVRLLNEMIGQARLQPEELARCFYYRVYFNMGVFGRIFEDVGLPADSIELIMNLVPPDANKPAMRPTLKTLLRLPRMLRFSLEKWYFAEPMSRALPVLDEQLHTFAFLNTGALSGEELIAEEARLYRVMEDVIYFNTVGQILMGMFNTGLRIQLAKVGVDFKDFDLMEGQAGLEAFDPNKHLHDLHCEFLALDPSLQDEVRRASYSEFMEMGGLQDFQSAVSAFIVKFGHLSDNGNDFSFVPWRESPDMVKQIITEFVPEKIEEHRKIRFAQVRKNPVLRALYKRARAFRFLREQVSSLYTYGYGLFRYYYLAMGQVLSRRGWIEEMNDVFYLTRKEILQAIRSTEPLFDYSVAILQHKRDIERYRNIAMPSIIYGDEPPAVQDPSLEKLIGIPTSIGHHTGRVASVRGLHDFTKVKEGDVLVIPYSDVSWTPLFARAGAVVSESGGLLSHSSIVAREYNIPAVVSAEGAMRLPDHTLVTVNGHTGEVIIHNQ
jgi:phosphohistidine swiveling domain-containing protein